MNTILSLFSEINESINYHNYIEPHIFFIVVWFEKYYKCKGGQFVPPSYHFLKS